MNRKTETTGGVSHTLTDESKQRFLRRKEVCELTTIPSSTLSDYVRQGIFPKPYKLTPDTNGRYGLAAWKWSDVLAWMDSRQQAG